MAHIVIHYIFCYIKYHILLLTGPYVDLFPFTWSCISCCISFSLALTLFIIYRTCTIVFLDTIKLQTNTILMGELVIPQSINLNVSTGGSCTHIIESQRCNISDRDLRPLMQHYCRKLINHEALPTIIEIPTEGRMVVSTMMLRYPSYLTGETYGDVFLMLFTACCQESLLENFHVSDDQFELFAVVTASNYVVQENGDGTCGVRVSFPCARVVTEESIRQYNNYLVGLLAKYNIFSTLASVPIYTIEQSLSYMYREFPVYRAFEDDFVYEYKYTFSPMSTDDLIGDYDLPNINECAVEFEEIFDVNSHPVIGNVCSDIDNSLDYLPVVLLPSFFPGVMRRVAKVVEIQEEKHILFGNVVYNDDGLDPTSVEYSIVMVKLFIMMLNISRYYSQSTWEEIGKAIYNSYNGSEEGLAYWYECSRKVFQDDPPEFVRSIFDSNMKMGTEILYNTYGTGNSITYKSLAWYAREDSPKKYKTWHHNWISESIMLACDKTNTNTIAGSIYRVLWLEIMYSQEEMRWFFFKNHMWIKSLEALEISGMISNRVARLYEHKRYEVVTQILTEADNAKKNRLNFLEGKLLGFYERLNDTADKNKFIRETKIFCLTYGLTRKRDSNPYLLGVRNGVLDFGGDTVTHRASKPEDYVTMSTRVMYREYSWENPMVIFLLDWLSKMFYAEGMLEYFLKLLPYSLVGKNPLRLIIQLVGPMGSEGKSVLMNALLAMLGDYGKTMPASTYKTDSKTGAPNPELARVVGTRMVFTNEATEDGEVMKDNLAKMISGEDKFFVRGLYQDGDELTPMFISWFIANGEIEFNNMDSALKDRVVMLMLVARWFNINDPDPTKRCPEDPAEQERRMIHPRDKNFPGKVSKLSSYLLWIICQYHSVLSADGLIMPNKILKDTNRYTYDQDKYTRFIDERLETAEGVYLTLDSLYEEYINWFLNESPHSREPKRNTFLSNIRVRLGRLEEGGWYGYKIKEVQGENVFSY